MSHKLNHIKYGVYIYEKIIRPACLVLFVTIEKSRIISCNRDSSPST